MLSKFIKNKKKENLMILGIIFFLTCFLWPFSIGIKHGFRCINVCQIPREMLQTEAVGQGFQHLLRDLANVNVLENNV